MQHLDLEVIDHALSWSNAGNTIWLCTVLATYGSSPRAPGAMLVARQDGQHVGSLSGGCVEEDFLEQLQAGRFSSANEIIRYGDNDTDKERLKLPCGGVLEVLVERLLPTEEHQQHLYHLQQALLGQQRCIRGINLETAKISLFPDESEGPRIERLGMTVRVRIGPVRRLVIAGISPVSVACADFARTLGFEVIVCDPREEVLATFDVPGINVQPVLPSLYLERKGCHAQTAIVALSHDPRIDDLAMIDAVQTPAFYIGVMGSHKTSLTRAERLRRSGGLNEQDIARIRMPIGLNVGSKTPAEIALAVMADIVRVYYGREK
ncbi:XdhC family protein [Oceanisphaera sediminis]|uniref:XdhC family protein n=1 Tax=Oceanisphaera sediminis TaxID=981381 RepID=A0ABP7DQN7_9GAMM